CHGVGLVEASVWTAVGFAVGMAVGTLHRECLDELRRRRIFGPRPLPPLRTLRLSAHRSLRLPGHRLRALATRFTLGGGDGDRLGVPLRDPSLLGDEGAAASNAIAVRCG